MPGRLRGAQLFVGSGLKCLRLWSWSRRRSWPSTCLRYHLCAMTVGQCLTSFFAVWTVHHDCEHERPFARTLRGLLKNGATFNMFFHMEHHLFPAVPTCHLPQLAERLDKAAPEMTRLRVF